jgi:hypothetical protein
MGTYTAILLFLLALKAPWKYLFAVAFGCEAQFQNVVTSVSFSIWETKRNHKGAKSPE